MIPLEDGMRLLQLLLRDNPDLAEKAGYVPRLVNQEGLARLEELAEVVDLGNAWSNWHVACASWEKYPPDRRSWPGKLKIPQGREPGPGEWAAAVSEMKVLAKAIKLDGFGLCPDCKSGSRGIYLGGEWLACTWGTCMGHCG